jgi:hypothetical protein
VVARRKSLDEPPLSLDSSVRPVLRRWVVQFVGLVLVVGLLLGCVLWLGSYARDQLRLHERFQVAFADIDCIPPVPLQRNEFLEEVRYHAQLPERMAIFQDGLADRLHEGFSKHPWVARVEKVELSPPHTVRVTLAYREPVLAVAVTSDLAGAPVDGGLDSPASSPALRTVDGQGILLPKKVPFSRSLPILYGAPRPAGGAGQVWSNPGVVAAARTAVWLKPYLERAGVTAMMSSEQGLVIWGSGYKMLWGRPPEQAKGEEASLVVKEQRFLELMAKRDSVGSWWPFVHEYDLRPRKAMTDRLVMWDRP